MCMCICVYVHTHSHTHTYFSSIKKNEILPFATTWVELECIMLSEISQSKTNTIWYINRSTGYLSKRYKHSDSKGHMHPNVYSEIINNSQILERAQMSIGSWMDKEDVVYIYAMGYHSAIKKNEILPFATTWMEL